MNNLWLPQRGIRSPLYYPHADELPAGDVFALGFDFENIGSLGTSDHAESVNEDFLLTHIMAVTDAVQNSFFVQIYHQHGSVQRQIFAKQMQVELVAGKARFPLMLPEPYLVGHGDTLTVAISNVAQAAGGAYAAANMQVVLWGVHPANVQPSAATLQDLGSVSLALRKAALEKMQSTVPSTAGIQTAHARSFQQDTAQPLPAYPAAGAGLVELARYQVPAGMSGSLTAIALVHIGAAGSFVDGSGVVVWHVLRNGAPEKGLENIYVQIGSISQPAGMALLLNQNDLIQVMVEVPAGKVAPAGNPFARLIGFLDYGGIGTQTLTGGPGAGATVAVNPITGTPTGVTGSSGGGSGSSYGGGTGGTRPYCFTGNVAFKTPTGFVRFGECPALVEIENETGRHLAELLVHECEGELLEFMPGKGVTFEHLMKHAPGIWVPAVTKYAGCKTFHFKGHVYNLHVRTTLPEDRHYILENGDVAHNAKPMPDVGL